MRTSAQPEERAAEANVAESEDFLFHLYRGSDLLMQDRVVEAKAELERALRDKPQDARSQDLLAGVYFRLGVYPRAIEIWSRLVAAYPDQAALRVNLGLVLFKTGQCDEAREQLRGALKLEPEHERAWGYLGLVEWRLGQHDRARDAFLRGGQATMAHRMEQELSRPPGAEALEPRGAGRAEERQALSHAAAGALDAVDTGALEVEADRPGRRRVTGRWNAVELAREAIPVAPPDAPEEVAAPPATLADTVVWPDAQNGLCLSPAGELVLSAEEQVYARLDELIVVSGELRTQIVERTGRGLKAAGPLGGKTPLFRWLGPVSALLAPPPGMQLELFSLAPGEPLFMREHALFAMVDGVQAECADLTLGREPWTVAQLRGEGAVAICVERPLTGYRVVSGRETRVRPERVVGWTGRLFPSFAGGTAPYSAGAPALCFRGDGLLLLG